MSRRFNKDTLAKTGYVCRQHLRPVTAKGRGCRACATDKRKRQAAKRQAQVRRARYLAMKRHAKEVEPLWTQ